MREQKIRGSILLNPSLGSLLKSCCWLLEVPHVLFVEATMTMRNIAHIIKFARHALLALPGVIQVAWFRAARPGVGGRIG